MQNKTNTNHSVINHLCTAIVNNDLALIKGMVKDKEIEIIDFFYIMMDPSSPRQQTTPYRLAKQNDNPAILTYFKEIGTQWFTFKGRPTKTKLFHAIINADLEAIRSLPPSGSWLAELEQGTYSALIDSMFETKKLNISHKTGRHFYVTPYNLAYVIGEQSVLDYFYNEVISAHPAYFSRFIMAIACHQPLNTLQRTKKSFFKAIPEEMLSEVISPLFKALKTYNLQALTYLIQDPKVRNCSQEDESQKVKYSLEKLAQRCCPKEALNVLKGEGENKNEPSTPVVSKKRNSFFSEPFAYLATCNQNHTSPNR